MKKVLLLTALLLSVPPTVGQGGSEKMALRKRVSEEKLILAEKYEKALQTCREITRKRARHSCIENKKNEFGKSFADLERNPGAYFAAKQQNGLDEKALQEMNERRSLP